MKGAEAGGFELQGQIRRHWIIRYQPRQAEEVDGPHVVVCQTVPEGFRRQRLAVVHVAFAGVVADDAVDHDVFFALAEPAFFASEPALGLGWRRGQVQEGNEADAAGDETFEGEEPAPAR